MSEPTAITTVDDIYLCQIIQSVKRRLVYMTPGMSDQVADAVCRKWDELVNDISVGLPAELNARRKQYEYYRDKLLTFKKLEKKYE